MSGSEPQAVKRVRIIPPTIDTTTNNVNKDGQVRVVAYCRVSTKMEAPGPYKGKREDIVDYIHLMYPEYTLY